MSTGSVIWSLVHLAVDQLEHRHAGLAQSARLLDAVEE
jgi:hypothetical protein